LLKVLRLGDGNRWSSNREGVTHIELEEAFAEYCGVRYAVTVNTGGMALKIALRAAGLRLGDGVLFQVNTCHAESFEVLLAGGVPIWADVDLETGGLSKASVEETLSQVEGVRFIVPIHTWGRPEDMDIVLEVAQKRNLVVIEDCCLALGAEWRGKKVGTLGLAGVFSFGYAKPLQAGEGGMIVTDDETFAKDCRILRNRGALWAVGEGSDVVVLGWNGRISAFASAVALAQLRKYPQLLACMQENARFLEEAIKAQKGLRLFREDERITAQSYTKLGFRVLPEELGVSRSLFCQALRAEGIPCQEGSFTTYRYSFFRGGEWKEWTLRREGLEELERNYCRPYPNAERFHDEVVYIPRNVLLKREGAEAAVEAIEKVCKNVSELQRLSQD